MCTCVYIHVPQHAETHGGQESPLELELQIALSQHGGAGSHTRVLCKSSKRSNC